jgi:hypothetical protein
MRRDEIMNTNKTEKPNSFLDEMRNGFVNGLILGTFAGIIYFAILFLFS